MDYVESKLGISYWWRWGVCSSRENCGFDVILLAAGRRGGSAGVQIFNVAVVAKWRNFLPSATEKWRANIDGVVQHEVSHLFGCKDVVDGHDKCACIMAYWEIPWPFVPFFLPISYIYEEMNYG